MRRGCFKGAPASGLLLGSPSGPWVVAVLSRGPQALP